ncbi:YciI family protein [Brevundimonas aurifodinae]|uniref:YciI family protein n=1 Tax=Brevundimonas aurifodinae TaxID=1508312 RepID=A0ABV1NL08_9CAUL
MSSVETLFAIAAYDHPGSGAVRSENRMAHLAYVGRHLDRLRLAGPFVDPSGQLCGSLMIVAMSLAEAQQFSAEDPYTRAGLFGEVRITAWSPVVGPLAPTG